MTFVSVGRIIVTVATVMVSVAAPARAQDRAVEIGTSLASLNFGIGEDNELNTLGVPTTGFTPFNPGLYASIFLGPRVAVEPQIGLIVLSGGGDTLHRVNLSVQFDYFIRGTRESSPYVFGSAGIVDISGPDTNPASVGAGAGYRLRVGDRLTFRFDGRYTHSTEGEGDAVTFAVSIGGLLGR